MAALGSTVSHRTVENTQIYMLDGLDWIGLDISKNTTTTRAPSGAKNTLLKIPQNNTFQKTKPKNTLEN